MAQALNIKDWLLRTFRSGSNVINPRWGSYYNGSIVLSQERYGKMIFVTITKLLTNLINDVTFIKKNGSVEDFATFNAFVNTQGQFALNRLFLDGYLVIGKSNAGLKILGNNEYNTIGKEKVMVATPINKELYTECYVMRSQTYDLMAVSDLSFCSPFIKYLDNSFNASNTALERLGALVVCSPKTPSKMPAVVTLTKEEKDDLEKEIETQYGALSKQKQIIILPQEMAFETISLANLDLHTEKRTRLAIEAICDVIGVPANQVALIDANSSKSLSNGSELIAGDFSKYQSFERLLNQTFVRMAEDMGLSVDYEIYNKPDRNKKIQAQETIQTI